MLWLKAIKNFQYIYSWNTGLIDLPAELSLAKKLAKALSCHIAHSKSLLAFANAVFRSGSNHLKLWHWYAKHKLKFLHLLQNLNTKFPRKISRWVIICMALTYPTAVIYIFSISILKRLWCLLFIVDFYRPIFFCLHSTNPHQKQSIDTKCINTCDAQLW